MDESALATKLASLESRADALEWWLFFWTAIVVVGVVFEIVPPLVEYRHELKEHLKNVISTPARPKKSDLLLHLFGTILVAFGVGGELVAQWQLEKTNSDIREIGKQRFSNVTLEAQRLRNANVGLQIELARLQDKMSDRHIKLATREVFHSKGIAACLSTPIEIWSRPSDGEAKQVAMEFFDIVPKGGVTMPVTLKTEPTWDPFTDPRGIAIRVSKDGPLACSQLLLETLKASDLDVKLEPNDTSIPERFIRVVVGSKAEYKPTRAKQPNSQ